MENMQFMEADPMAIRGINPAHDLDVAVKDELYLYQELCKKYPEKKKMGRLKDFIHKKKNK